MLGFLPFECLFLKRDYLWPNCRDKRKVALGLQYGWGPILPIEISAICVKKEISLWILDYIMAIRSLLFDFKVFAPFSIDYQKALDHLADTGQFVKPAPADVFAQIKLVRENSPKKEFDEFAPMMSGLLDEIEITQVGNYSLNMGVKNGLASLSGLDVSVVALTELGTAAAENS